MIGWLSSSYANTPLSIPLGSAIAKKLKTALGAKCVGDLVRYLPHKYAAQGRTLDVTWEELGETITTIVQVKRIAPQSPGQLDGRDRRKFPLKLVLTDGKRDMPAAIFGNEWLRKVLFEGMRLVVIGTLSEFRGDLQLKNVDVLVLKDDGTIGPATGKLATLTKTTDGLAEVQRLLSKPFLPIYRGKKGIPGLHFAVYMQRLMEWLPAQPDPLGTTPEGFVSFDKALRGIHFPSLGGPELPLQRLKFDEALELQIAVGLRRVRQGTLTAPQCPATSTGARQQLRAGLPFSLTPGQERVIAEIQQDLESTRPMSRLLAGEVGSGKTVVAMAAMLQAVDSGRQCAMLAPTEVLATQHFRNLTEMVDAAGLTTRVRLLTGSLPTASRRAALLDIVSGEADIVVGTHALISEGVEFFDLGLVVVDEQHRFGVRQRDELRTRGRGGLTPHVLVMTATPIPRTVAMTVFGDVDVSELTELPGGRKEIKSFVVPSLERPAWEQRAWQRIAEEIEQGNRAFIVCPRINAESSDPWDESLESNYARAMENLPHVRIGVLHGKLAPEEKDEAMRSFAAGDSDVLLATTVVEVGVDVPEATVMMIRRAESFGVSQLHQLRGRVGRGDRGGICFLCTHTRRDTPERTRLERIAATNDGVALAELDLETRSFGDVLGEEQSGIATGLGLVDLVHDGAIIDAALAVAQRLLDEDRQTAMALTLDITDEQADFLDRA